METTPKIGAYNYRYGAIAAGIGIVFSLVIYFLRLENLHSIFNRVIILLIPTLTTVVAVFNFKKNEVTSYNIKNFIKIGIGVFLIYTIIYNLYLLLFFKFTSSIETNLITQFLNSLPPTLIKNIILGMMVGLIIGLISKKS